MYAGASCLLVMTRDLSLRLIVQCCRCFDSSLCFLKANVSSVCIICQLQKLFSQNSKTDSSMHVFCVPYDDAGQDLER